MNDLEIKVCGITAMKQVEELALMGVDYAGFIFYEKSPRFVGKKIDSFALKQFDAINKTGVFVNADIEFVLKTVEDYGLNFVQLHGNETPDFCARLKQLVPVVKAFGIKNDISISNLVMPYEAAVNYFLFDTKATSYGGTGRKFDWSVLENQPIFKPYFLSGGIGANDAENIKDFNKLQKVFALDLNSRFEVEPGVKDMDLLKAFIKKIR